MNCETFQKVTFVKLEYQKEKKKQIEEILDVLMMRIFQNQDRFQTTDAESPKTPRKTKTKKSIPKNITIYRKVKGKRIS